MDHGWQPIRALRDSELILIESLAEAVLVEINGKRSWPELSPGTELDIFLLEEGGLSQIERSIRNTLREAWSKSLRNAFQEPNAVHVDDKLLVTATDYDRWLGKETSRAQSEPVHISVAHLSSWSNPTSWSNLDPEDLLASAPFSANPQFSRHITESQWDILCANAYQDWRWSVEVRGNLIWMKRPGTALLCVRATEREGGMLLDSLRIGSKSKNDSEICGTEIAWKLIDDVLEQGAFLFKETVFAVAGDVHGRFNLMVEEVRNMQAHLEREVSFVLQVGDLMPVRSTADLAYVHGPKKYKNVGDFPEYYLGNKHLPWPVYFIGGNHEPYGFLHEFNSKAETCGAGAPIIQNLNYLGRVGWANVLGVTILGMSGIFSPGKHNTNRPTVIDRDNAREFAYFNSNDLVDVYHTWDSVFSEWTDRIDVVLLHDWPAGLLPLDDILRIDQKYEHIRDSKHLSWASMFEIANPRVVCCGHHHLRRVYPMSAGKPTEVVCLADIEKGADAVAFFRKYKGEVQRVTSKHDLIGEN